MTIEDRDKLTRDNIRGVIIALIILTLIVLIGVAGFILIEGMNLVDAIYMTVITVSTVGFREVKELSQNGEVFTIFLIIISLGIYGYVLTNFARYLVTGIFTNYFKNKKVRQKINALSDHVIVVGYGRNGRQTIEDLLAHDENIVLIEKDENIISDIRYNTKLLYIQGDASNDDILKDAGIDRAKALVASLPVDADNLFVVLSARQINPKLKIIARASQENSDVKLKRAGANNVIMPAKTGGQRMAKLVSQPDIVEFMDYVLLQTVNESSIEEVSCKELICNDEQKTIRELNIRESSGVNILGIRKKDGSYQVNPGPDVSLSCDDQIFVLGSKSQVEEMKKIMS